MSLACGLRMASVIDRLGSGGCQRREVSASVPQGTHVSITVLPVESDLAQGPQENTAHGHGWSCTCFILGTDPRKQKKEPGREK